MIILYNYLIYVLMMFKVTISFTKNITDAEDITKMVFVIAIISFPLTFFFFFKKISLHIITFWVIICIYKGDV